jgi:hypothetical protein
MGVRLNYFIFVGNATRRPMNGKEEGRERGVYYLDMDRYLMLVCLYALSRCRSIFCIN